MGVITFNGNFMGNPDDRDGAEQQAGRNENKNTECNEVEHVQRPLN
jgi:hypothetical protein